MYTLMMKKAQRKVLSQQAGKSNVLADGQMRKSL